MLPRPRPEESEEDLLKIQDQFLRDAASKASPAAAVVRNIEKRKAEGDLSGDGSACPQTQRNSEKIPEDRSISDATRRHPIGSRAQALPGENRTNKKVKWKPNDTQMDVSEPEGPAVLLDIIECDIVALKVQPPIMRKGESFPVARRRDIKLNRPANGSLFAQQMRKSRAQTESKNDRRDCGGTQPARSVTEMPGSDPTTSAAPNVTVFGDSSTVVDGTGLADSTTAKEIHQENVSKLMQMSQTDILKEQQELLGILNPDLIQFLKSKCKKISDGGDKKGAVEQMDADAIEKYRVDVSKLENSNETQHKQNSESTPPLGELPIPPSEAKRWLHMDKVEIDKLSWMTNLPQPKPIEQNSGYPARFNFEGVITARDSDIPTHQGLHHHGEEPEVPGYTLEELFIYGRSAIMQQRVLALSILAKILTKAKEGLYDECLSEPLLPQLLDAGLALLLRWALDDNTEGNVAAAVVALHALVVSNPDEICLYRTLWWYRGLEMPFIQSEIVDNSEKSSSEKEGSEDELIDAELVKLDVIKGLVRMDVLPRLRYILEVCKPSATIVVQIVEILTRIASHSLESAFAITKCPRLLQTLVSEFLPKSWASADGQLNIQGQLANVSGIPLPQVVKLIGTLASTGRHIAVSILAHYDIMDSLLYYASIDLNAGYLPTKEAMQLCILSYSAWNVFMHYGLAIQSYLDFYPIIMQQMQYFQTLCMNGNVAEQAYRFDQAAALLQLLTTVLDLMVKKQEPEGTTTALLKWQQVNGLLVVVEIYIKKWLWELEKAEQITHSALRLVGAALGWLATFYQNLSKQPWTFNQALDKIEKLYTSAIVPFIKSKSFEKLLTHLCSSSSLLCQMPNGKRRDPANLTSLGAILWGGQLNPILDEPSPYSFLTQLTRCLYLLNRQHSGLGIEIRALFLDHPAVISYLRQIALLPTSTETNHWFSRFETHFVHYLLLLSALKTCTYTRVYHEAALHLLPKLQRGDEDLGLRLMSAVIFNEDFLSEFGDISANLDSLKLKESQFLAAPTAEKTEVSQIQLLSHTCLCIPSINTTYQTYLEKHLALQHLPRFQNQDSLRVSRYLVQPIPVDFAFLPISILYTSSVDTAGSSGMEAADIPGTVLHCLQWCHLMECWRKDPMCAIPPHVRFCRLATVFLISPDLFLLSDVRAYLEGCFLKEAERKVLSQLKLGKNPLPGIASFSDIYIQLLEQFEGTSYGDHLFGMVVLLPMQQKFSIEFRKAVWTEHISMGRILGVGIQELLVPLQNYLSPIEDDSDLLFAFFRALINGYIRQAWCPVLYVIAIHHLHHFLYASTISESQKNLRFQMLHKLQEPKNEEISKIMRYYKKPDPESATGFVVEEATQAVQSEHSLMTPKN